MTAGPAPRPYDDDELPDKSGLVGPDGTIAMGELLKNVSFYGVTGDPSPQSFPAIIQGPPGPMMDLSEMPIPGTVPEAAVSFVVDGWEYRFPSIHHARLVREKLTSMTLEGEL